MQIRFIITILLTINTLYGQYVPGRHEKAAAYLNDVDTVIEIGGAGRPISKFVSGKRVIVIDPVINRFDGKNVTFIKKSIENWDCKVESANYAVVLMGLSLTIRDQRGWNKLYTLIDGAKKVVIEHSEMHKDGKKQYEQILRNTNKKLMNEESFNMGYGPVVLLRSIHYLK